MTKLSDDDRDLLENIADSDLRISRYAQALLEEVGGPGGGGQ